MMGWFLSAKKALPQSIVGIAAVPKRNRTLNVEGLDGTPAAVNSQSGDRHLAHRLALGWCKVGLALQQGSS